MVYYDRLDMLQTVKCAYKGDAKAKAVINAIAVPYAVTSDYSAMILVQDKHSTTNSNGMTDVPAKDNCRQQQVADIYRCDEEGASGGSVPIPKSFPISHIRQESGVFSFISHNQIVAGTPIQIEKAMYDAIFAVNGASEAEIERCFFSIPTKVVDDRPAKTVADNPPIDDIIGMLIFDERLQWFTTSYKTINHSFLLVIDTDNRSEALKILPLVRHTVARLDTVDSNARLFASDELLELKNDDWLDDDEAPVTRMDFIARMSIETMSFDNKGGYEISYDDGGLFFGHCICVKTDSNGKPKEADIQG